MARAGADARQRFLCRRLHGHGESPDQRRVGVQGGAGTAGGALRLTIMASPASEKLRTAEQSPAFDSAAALRAIETVIGDAPRPVALHEPHFGGREWDYVKETLDSG